MSSNPLFSTLSIETELDALLISKASNRFYLSGFSGSSGFLLLTPQANILLTDFRYAEQAQLEAAHFKVMQQGENLTETLEQLTRQYNIRTLGLEKDVVTLAQYERYTSQLPKVRFVPVNDPCENRRRVKTKEEIAKLKKAIEIADKTLLHIKGFLCAGLTEREIALELEFFMQRLGSQGIAFETIVASGPRSALPHGTASEKTIISGDLVTLDFGAVYQGYRSDITRTFMLGRPDHRQEEIYQLVLKAQEAAIAAIQPGIEAAEVDRIAREIIAAAGYGRYFGHGLGHGLGLDVHEGPRLSPQDRTVLEPGMVVTVEPGIYLPGSFGVRIEDVVLVVPGGCQVLTQSPKGFSDMILMNTEERT